MPSICLLSQGLYYAQQYFVGVSGVSRPIAHTFAERDFMLFCIVTLLFFVVGVILYITSGQVPCLLPCLMPGLWPCLMPGLWSCLVTLPCL